MFSIEFGTNDVSLTYLGNERMRRLNQTEEELHSELMWHYFDATEQLYQAGARAFTFHLLVAYDRARVGSDQGSKDQARMKESITNYNNRLRRGVEAYCRSKFEETDGDIFCALIDLHALGNEIMDHPRKYGFLEAFDFCWPYAFRETSEPDLFVDPSCKGPVSVYVWRDGVHPSYKFHEYWADEFRKEIRRSLSSPSHMTPVLFHTPRSKMEGHLK